MKIILLCFYIIVSKSCICCLCHVVAMLSYVCFILWNFVQGFFKSDFFSEFFKRCCYVFMQSFCELASIACDTLELCSRFLQTWIFFLNFSKRYSASWRYNTISPWVHQLLNWGNLNTTLLPFIYETCFNKEFPCLQFFPFCRSKK